ncbi:hypothetical protein [Leptothrix ochracea]
MTRLQEKAMLFRLVLEHASQSTSGYTIKNIFQEIKPLLDDISQGKIVSPMRYAHGYHFHSLESPLFNKYPSLASASANMAMVLEDLEIEYPSDHWSKPELLREHTKQFFILLMDHALHDAAARQLLDQMRPIMDDIEHLRVKPPIVNTYRWWFTDPKSPLFNKYPDLTEAASDFDAAIEEGWFITGNGKLFGREN